MARRPGFLHRQGVRQNVLAARAFALGGKYSRALTGLERAARLEQGARGREDRCTLLATTELATALAAAGRAPDAVTMLEDVALLLLAHYPDDDPQLSDTAHLLDLMYPLAGVHTVRTGPLGSTPRGMLPRSGDDLTDHQLWCGHHLAVACQEAGDLCGALTAVQESGLLTADRHEALPRAQWIQQEALAAFRRMRDHARDGAPPLTADDAGAVSFLDWCCSSPPEGVDPLRLRRDLLDWFDEHRGAGSAEALAARSRYADALLAAGRAAEAYPVLRAVHEGRRALLPSRHPDLLDAARKLAKALSDRAEYVEAAELAGPVLDDHRRTLGDDHDRTATAALVLATSLLAQDRRAEAEPALAVLRVHGYEVEYDGAPDDHADAAGSTDAGESKGDGAPKSTAAEGD